MSAEKGHIHIVLCVSRSWGRPAYEPSFRTRCRECGERLWIAPSSAEMVNHGLAVPLCYACGLDHTEHPDVVFAVGPGQEAEVFEKLGMEGVDKVHALIEILNSL